MEKRGVIYKISGRNVVRPIPNYKSQIFLDPPPPILSGIFFFSKFRRFCPKMSITGKFRRIRLREFTIYEAVMASINFIKKNVYHYVKEI